IRRRSRSSSRRATDSHDSPNSRLRSAATQSAEHVAGLLFVVGCEEDDPCTDGIFEARTSDQAEHVTDENLFAPFRSDEQASIGRPTGDGPTAHSRGDFLIAIDHFVALARVVRSLECCVRELPYAAPAQG